jgi:hypothetical protein
MATSETPETAEPARPALRIVSGSPTPEELAAVTAIVAAGSSGAGDAPERRAIRGGWSDPAARHRPALIPGPNAWRSSGW